MRRRIPGGGAGASGEVHFVEGVDPPFVSDLKYDDMLRVNGVRVEVAGDDLIVEGRGHVPGGGLVATHMDHRIAMSALVMGLASEKPVRVDDTTFIATSFPGFVPMMRGLGAALD